MNLNLSLKCDETTTTRIMSNHLNNQSFGGCCSSYMYKPGCDCFCKSPNKRAKKMKSTELRYQSEDQILKSEIKFSETEEKLQRILTIEHNTIDIINENLKLKEALKFIRSCYAADIGTAEDRQKTYDQAIDELTEKLNNQGKTFELKSAECSELNLNLQKKVKDYDELYSLLGERERELEQANTFSEQLLNDKKKLLGIIEQKDRGLEQSKVDLYQKEQKLQSILEEHNKHILDGKADKNKMTDNLARQGNKIAELTRTNAELMNEIESLETELKKLQDRPSEDINIKNELDNKLKEIIALRSEISNQKQSLGRERENSGTLKTQFGDFQKKYNDLKGKYDDLLNQLNAKAQEAEDERTKSDQISKKLNAAIDLHERLIEDHDELDRKYKILKRDYEAIVGAKTDTNNQLKNVKLNIQSLTDQINEKDNDIGGLKRQLEQAKYEKEKMQKIIGDFGVENEKIKRLLEEKSKDCNKFLAELDLLRKEVSNHIDKQSENEAEIQRLNNQSVQKLEELKSQIAVLEKRLKETDEKNRALAQKYNMLVDQHEDTRGAYNDLVQKLTQVDNEKAELDEELKNLQNDYEVLKKRHMEQSTDLNSKNKAIENLKLELDEIRKNAGLKSALDEYKREVSEKMIDLLKKIGASKNRTFEIVDAMMETETSNYPADEEKILKMTAEQYFIGAAQLLADLDGALPELMEECERTKTALVNLQKEKTKLLLKVQEFDSKFTDLKLRHDHKTDMIGKLTVKLFIFSNEIERIQKK